MAADVALAGAIAVAAGLLALIAALVIQVRRRRIAELGLRESEERYRKIVDTQHELALAENALRETEARTSAILRALPDMMFVLTIDGLYVDFYARDRRDLYVPPEQFLGRHIADVMPPELAQRFTTALKRAANATEPVVVDYTLTIQGEERPFEARLVPDERGHIVSIVRDLAEQHRMRQALGQREESLRTVKDRNEDLVSRLIASQENERRRVARELHDDTSQKLALLAVAIDQLQHDEASGSPLRAALRDLYRQSAELANDVHRLSHQLHPSKLEALGLQTALDSICRETSVQHRIVVQSDFGGVPADLDSEVSLCIYRIAQESLRNVVKHSGARHVALSLTSSGSHLELVIADQGCGFSVMEAERTGLGLISIRERANAIGVQAAIYSMPGRGTRITVRVPLTVVRADTLADGRRSA